MFVENRILTLHLTVCTSLFTECYNIHAHVQYIHTRMFSEYCPSRVNATAMTLAMCVQRLQHYYNDRTRCTESLHSAMVVDDFAQVYGEGPSSGRCNESGVSGDGTQDEVNVASHPEDSILTSRPASLVDSCLVLAIRTRTSVPASDAGWNCVINWLDKVRISPHVSIRVM